jgi:putative radical SAM enzyme (TIGR03279 family)
MITVAEIEKGSDAELAGMLPGDKITRVNNEEIRDNLDFEFFRSEGYLAVELLRDGESMAFEIERDSSRTLGIEPEVMKIKICRNDCVFCFVYQTPKGMRKSLYVKDEDYRYSFLDGHFTTLSNMKSEDWERVVAQRLSPIYISVHATNHELRMRLLKNQKLEPILDRLAWLRDHDLRFHTQLVVVPGWNDGEELERSLRELRLFHPWLLSISVVPVGLTRHRTKLTPLNGFSEADYHKALEITLRHEAEAFAETGEHFIYPSDEIYVRSGTPIPPTEFYGKDFNQYQNGVGTLRSMMEDLNTQLPDLPHAPEGHEVTVLTAPLASKTLGGVLGSLREERGLQSELIVCENLTFGDSVTVTGLLCGKDLAAGIEQSHGKGPVLLPPNSLNREGRFLDDMSPADLEQRFGRRVFAPASFREYFPV